MKREYDVTKRDYSSEEAVTQMNIVS